LSSINLSLNIQLLFLSFLEFRLADSQISLVLYAIFNYFGELILVSLSDPIKNIPSLIILLVTLLEVLLSEGLRKCEEVLLLSFELIYLYSVFMVHLFQDLLLVEGKLPQILLEDVLLLLHLIEQLLIPTLILLLFVSVFLRFLDHFRLMRGLHINQAVLVFRLHLSFGPLECVQLLGKFGFLLADALLDEFDVSLSPGELFTNLLLLSVFLDLDLFAELVQVLTEGVPLFLGNENIVSKGYGRQFSSIFSQFWLLVLDIEDYQGAISAYGKKVRIVEGQTQPLYT